MRGILFFRIPWGVFILGVFAGCAAVPRADEKYFLPAQPLNVLEVVNAPVGVGKLAPTMPAGTPVGAIYNSLGKATTILRSGTETRGEYRSALYEELRKAGYETASRDAAILPKDLSGVRVVIGGDIIDAHVNVFQSSKGDEVEYLITILWRVFDRSDEREIFETQTKAAAKAPSFSEAEVQAFRASFRRLLAESQLVDTLKRL